MRGEVKLDGGRRVGEEALQLRDHAAHVVAEGVTERVQVRPRRCGALSAVRGDHTV